MQHPPCYDDSRFIDPPPVSFHPDAIAAMDTCQSCPLITACARAALSVGDTVDKQHRAPASGVIQAGVYCEGDQRTADALAAVAGVPAPEVTTPRYTPPDHCQGCGEPMVARDKTQPTSPDVLTHAAHGYCRICDAKRRRQPGWQSPQPKHSTLFAWKETRTRAYRNSGRHHHRPAGLNPHGPHGRGEPHETPQG